MAREMKHNAFWNKERANLETNRAKNHLMTFHSPQMQM